MVAPVEVGEGGLGLLVSNGLLKEHQTRDRRAVSVACLAALEQWAESMADPVPRSGSGTGGSLHGGCTETLTKSCWSAKRRAFFSSLSK